VFSIVATLLILPLMERLKEMAADEGSTSRSDVYRLSINYLAFWATYFMLGMLIRNHSQARVSERGECVCVCVCVCVCERERERERECVCVCV